MYKERSTVLDALLGQMAAPILANSMKTISKAKVTTNILTL